MRRLKDKISQYSNIERDNLAKEHAKDLLLSTLTFSNLYCVRITATL